MAIPLTNQDLLDIAAWMKDRRGEYTWKLQRFILPRVCEISGIRSGFFAEMYVGYRTSKYSPGFTFQKIVSKEAMMLAKLKGQEIV